MLVYTEIYGQDIDGNRGQLQYCEPGRNDYTIYLYAEQHEVEIEFDVLASDYFTYDELKELA